MKSMHLIIMVMLFLVIAGTLAPVQIPRAHANIAIGASLAPSVDEKGLDFVNPGISGVCTAMKVPGTLHHFILRMRNNPVTATATGTMLSKVYTTTGTPSGGNCVSRSTLVATSDVKDLNILTTVDKSIQFNYTLHPMLSGVIIVTIEITLTNPGSNPSIQVLFGVIDGSQTAIDNSSGAFNDVDNVLCSFPDNCISYNLFVDPPNTLCNQGVSGGILGSQALIVVLVIIVGRVLTNTESDTSEDMKLAVKIVTVIAVAILAVTLILAVSPAGGPC
ncbi:MAG TPA: hypothetical protein VEP90_26235 [Methylomirabilota bacterium]|nr:hypothetical protein [Methylomirabilota bacterium]